MHTCVKVQKGDCTEWYVVGIECLIPNGPMPCSRQLRFSLYSGAVITEG